MTEVTVSSPSRVAVGARVGGAVLCLLGLVLMVPSALVASALGVESLAAAFWCWARAAEDAGEQVPRWAWLRRPALALWLAVGLHAAFPGLSHAGAPIQAGAPELLLRLEAIAVVWAGLELLAALPLARPYSDLPGPLLTMRPWLPVILPAAGFAVLWRHAPHWIGVVEVRRVAVPLLLVTAVLGALRAFARRRWTASLRWLAVSDSALAALLVALRAVPARASLLLWLAACGGHAFLLAGELRGSTPRRGPVITRLWRVASWAAVASLSWPALMAAGFGEGRGWNALYFAGAAFPVMLMSWITVGRMVAAPERRLMVRPNPSLTLSHMTALVVLALGPVALIVAWWTGFEPSAWASLVALGPAFLGGAAALAARWGRETRFWKLMLDKGAGTPALAGNAFRIVVELERRVIGVLAGVVRAVTVPLHDLHTGDAQEYLLFLVGLAVLALMLPLLQ